MLEVFYLFLAGTLGVTTGLTFGFFFLVTLGFLVNRYILKIKA